MTDLYRVERGRYGYQVRCTDPDYISWQGPADGSLVEAEAEARRATRATLALREEIATAQAVVAAFAAMAAWSGA